MTKEIKSEEEAAKEEADKQKAVKEFLDHPDVQEELGKKIDKESEEKARKMFLRSKIEDANADVLSKELESYSRFEEKEFKSLISDREKLLSDPSKASINELEAFSNKIDTARNIERSFKKMQESYLKVDDDKPNISASGNSLPNTLDEIESNPSAYSKYAIHENFYLTNDPHKEFKDHEKNNLCSIYDESCKEASDTWYKEYVLSKNRNKRHIKNLKIL